MAMGGSIKNSWVSGYRKFVFSLKTQPFQPFYAIPNDHRIYDFICCSSPLWPGTGKQIGADWTRAALLKNREGFLVLISTSESFEHCSTPLVGCLLYDIWDYTTQYMGDDHNPLWEFSCALLL